MPKEKEQQDKLKAVKARLLYGGEPEKNPRRHVGSRYAESKTPTVRTEPRRKHGNRRSEAHHQLLGGKERSASGRSDSHPEGSHVNETEAQPRRHHHRSTSSRRASGHLEREESEGGHWKSNSKGHRSSTYEDDLSQP
ncbi:hypothetical protein Tco_1143210 [Tanacetum coccineum]